MAKEYNIELVAVLPSAMIGGEAFAPLNVSYNIIRLILKKSIPVETRITLNWIDVKDVAEGCWLAATKGRNGERYILANEKCTSIRNTTGIAQQVFPQLKIKLPMTVPKPLLYAIAFIMEIGSKITGRAPSLSVKDISMFSGLQQNFDITRAKTELGFNPKSADIVLRESMQYLHDHDFL